MATKGNWAQYDVVVIGSGSAGLTAAKTARGFGKTVLLVDKRGTLGGTCTWTGCVPSKALIKAAQVAHTIQNAAQFGIQCSTVSSHDGEHISRELDEYKGE